MKKHSKKINTYWRKIPWNKIGSIIQNVSSFLAIPGTIFAFVLAFRNDDDLQKQISNLQTIADESQKQTELLIAERDSLAIRWKQQIQPVFEIECDYLGGYEIEANLINSGKVATDIKVIEITDFRIEIPFKNLGEGMKGKCFIIVPEIPWSEARYLDLYLKLSFKDVTGNVNFQTIEINDFIDTLEKQRGIPNG